jgi:hypothetical protein
MYGQTVNSMNTTELSINTAADYLFTFTPATIGVWTVQLQIRNGVSDLYSNVYQVSRTYKTCRSTSFPQMVVSCAPQRYFIAGAFYTICVDPTCAQSVWVDGNWQMYWTQHMVVPQNRPVELHVGVQYPNGLQCLCTAPVLCLCIVQ